MLVFYSPVINSESFSASQQSGTLRPLASIIRRCHEIMATKYRGVRHAVFPSLRRTIQGDDGKGDRAIV